MKVIRIQEAKPKQLTYRPNIALREKLEELQASVSTPEKRISLQTLIDRILEQALSDKKFTIRL